ncbi:MAG TPA: cadmium transporter [Micromonosporaceae bacterium]|nr:cadmium transporter [Micromonosporaceae bacterium]HCU49827.1 cadmium transporter [Micromonosporaceae bacterium]
MAATIAVAVGVFAGTNVDDLIILTVLFLSSRASGSPKGWQIWAGQYTGIAVLIAASAIAAMGLSVVPDRWVGLLGLVPFGLGAWAMAKTIRAHGADDLPSPAVARSMAAVAGITVANGADNISVYTPLMRTVGLADSLVTIAVFAILVAVWVSAGSWLGSHRKVVAIINRYGHWIVPAVFMLIGAVILIESGVLTRIGS